MAAVGVMAGLGSGHGVVWLDAHGDFNTPDTTRSTFLDGMAVAVLVGSCWSAAAASVPGFEPVPEASIALIGTRDLDLAERERLRASEVGVLGSPAALGDDRLRSQLRALRAHARAVYLHVDLDVLDPTDVGPANRFAAAGGLSVDDVRNLVGALKQECEIAAATISAYDPTFDTTHAVRDAAIEIVREIVAD
jgi:arginase